MKCDERLKFRIEQELEEQFIRASGPGGQNVNKLSTAVELRFNVVSTPALSGAQKARLNNLAGSRVSKDGFLIIRADRFRTREQNRNDARQRLYDLIEAALIEPKPRVKTKPSRAAKKKRTDEKARRGEVKRRRGNVSGRDWS